MDTLFKYPLFRAHKQQIEAEEKELRGDISSAVRLREEALSNLNLALKSTNQDCVRRNLQLQINHEENQLERLYFHEKETRKLIDSLRQTIRETQGDGMKKETTSDILDTTETMESLLNEMESKLQLITEDLSALTKCNRPIPENPSIRKFIPTQQDEDAELFTSHLQDISSLTQAIKENHVKNTRLIRMLLNTYCAMKINYEELQAAVNNMNGKFGKSKDGPEAEASTVNISLSASTPPTIIDLVPLESPRLDFLQTEKLLHNM